MRGKIIRAAFRGDRYCSTSPVWQYDYGQELHISGLALPEVFEVHFGNTPEAGFTKTQIGGDGVVSIPDEYLTTGLPIYAFIYLHSGDADGETEYCITIPVNKRPKPSDQEPTPVQQDAITEAIAALNAAVEQTGENVASTERSAAASVESTIEAAARAEDAAASAGEAEKFAGQAAESAAASEASKESARDAETAAAGYTAQAQGYADAAAASASNAETSADRAEQAATTAGYMVVTIDKNGHLIYTRTDQIGTDFRLMDGHLIMESVA